MIAARLSENPNVSVTLIERGELTVSLAFVQSCGCMERSMPKVIIYFKADDTKDAYTERGNGGAVVHLSRVPVPSEYIRVGHEEYCVEVVRHHDQAAEGYDAAVFARKARFGG